MKPTIFDCDYCKADIIECYQLEEGHSFVCEECYLKEED